MKSMAKLMSEKPDFLSLQTKNSNLCLNVASMDYRIASPLVTMTEAMLSSFLLVYSPNIGTANDDFIDF
jgi:hypothetical protein